MHLSISVLSVLALPVVLAACSDHPTSLEAPRVPSSIAAARGTVDTRSRANVVWDDQVLVGGALVPAGIRGDSRNRYGQNTAPFNEYQSDFCGVRSFVYDQKGDSGNLDFDPDTYFDASTMTNACGSAPRSMNFYLAGASGPSTVVAPHVIVSSVWSLAPGAARLQAQVFGMQLVTCRIDFDATYPGASNVRVTRLADTVDAAALTVRRWRVESQGNHTAACLNPTLNGKYVDSKLRYYLPFAATVTQVRYSAGLTYP